MGSHENLITTFNITFRVKYKTGSCLLGWELPDIQILLKYHQAASYQGPGQQDGNPAGFPRAVWQRVLLWLREELGWAGKQPLSKSRVSMHHFEADEGQDPLVLLAIFIMQWHQLRVGRPMALRHGNRLHSAQQTHCWRPFTRACPLPTTHL